MKVMGGLVGGWVGRKTERFLLDPISFGSDPSSKFFNSSVKKYKVGSNHF